MLVEKTKQKEIIVVLFKFFVVSAYRLVLNTVYLFLLHAAASQNESINKLLRFPCDCEVKGQLRDRG